jgi:hypothetical protein
MKEEWNTILPNVHMDGSMKKLFLLLLLPLMLMSNNCTSTRNMMQVRNSAEAERLFFNGKVAEKYNYYYYGSERKPIALLALSKQYSVQSKFWHATELTDTLLQNWVALFENDPFKNNSEYLGKEIVSPQSQTIGLVLSRYYWVTAWFEDADSSIITIPPPDLTQQQPDYNKQFRDRP